MFNFFPKWREYACAGLDISDQSVKFVVIGGNGPRQALQVRALQPLPQGVVEQGRIKDSNQLVGLVKNIYASHSAHNASLPATIGISESLIFMHHFSLPRSIAEQNLMSVLYHEAEQIMPMNLEESVCDFALMRETEETYELVFAVAEKKVVAQYRDLARAIGIRGAALEPESLALFRSITEPADFAVGAAVVIDFGSRGTNLFLADEHGLQFSVTSDRGGEHITEAIAAKFGISRESAEQRKITRGFHDEDLFLILQYDPQRVILEMDGLIHFYEEHNKKKVRKIFLTGGGALLPGLLRYFALNVDKSVLLISESDDILYATAIGLAMRHAEKTKTIDFFARM